MQASEKSVPGGIVMALATERTEILSVTMRQLRQQAAEGTLVGEELESVLNALEGLCEQLIHERRAGVGLVQRRMARAGRV